MRIFKPNGTSFWQYEFVLNGKRYHKSTKMTNEREALKIANVAFTALVKAEAGIGEPKPVPTLRAFREDFVTAVQAEKQDKPKTVRFYTYAFDSLLKYEPLAEARLDRIDERLVQRFTVWALARSCERDEERTCSVATVNRWRATLRKALRMARRWKVIQTVPEIPRLKGERERSFVFTEALRKKYDELAPEPLNSFVQFSCEIGICEGETIDLVKADVHMTDKADEWGHYGYLQIRKGKTEFRKRSLPITPRAKEILTKWMAKSKSDLVFTREDRISPISAFTLIQQQERMRSVLKLPWDACVHSARHTALTNLGLTGVDPFTLQRAAGHANITTTRKYVHPTPPTMKDAFQKKVRSERRDRRAARKRAARIRPSPSIGQPPATDTVQ
ncbi:MAG TPA: tyrosine-type recombinase/integrase [Terriglobales bacterium]|nr:tyrosine-type recombinase/integrase [Terriglobales bacterium]